ncbi:RNA-binding protein 43 [Elgaria multicarinata webbii]|uniref:RNA-binding protein 43 n=1 Tax=Elgaria multicarinata webbii TaxID=159646 RepID=UPI002FCD0624
MATAQAAKPERTIVVCGVPDGLLDDDIMADILMIHFQKAKNSGGDVEDVAYPTSTKGVAYVTFEDKWVAEEVLTKGEHSLEDKRLHRSYPLKVSLYGGSVFTCVTCTLNLSIFGEKYNLADLVQDLKKSLPRLSFGPLSPNGLITVQGPFSAIRILQDKLSLEIKHSLSEQHVKGRERVLVHKPAMKPTSSGFSSEPRNNFVQSTSKEGQTVALDTDIYLYMKKFRDQLYQKCLEKHSVTSFESVDGELTTIYLSNDNTKPGPGQLERAKNTIEELLADLHCFLRKERLPLDGTTRTEKRKHEQACELVGTQYPKVLMIPYQTHIDIIGSSSDVYEFSQQVNKMAGNVPKQPWR